MDGRDAQLIAGAEAIADDLHGPAGAIPLDRVVARHLTWFALCRERGMSWPQICRLLHAHGAGREGGLPFTHGHLSAVVWRQRQKPISSRLPPSPPAAEPERIARRRGSEPRISDRLDRGPATGPLAPKRKPKPVRRAVDGDPLEGQDGLVGEAVGFVTGDQTDAPTILSESEAERIRALMARAAGRRR